MYDRKHTAREVILFWNSWRRSPAGLQLWKILDASRFCQLRLEERVLPPPHSLHLSGKETGNKTVSSLFTDGGEGGLATCFSFGSMDFQIHDYVPRVMQRAQPPLISCSSAVFFSLVVCGPQDGSEQTWIL